MLTIKLYKHKMQSKKVSFLFIPKIVDLYKLTQICSGKFEKLLLEKLNSTYAYEHIKTILPPVSDLGILTTLELIYSPREIFFNLKELLYENDKYYKEFNRYLSLNNLPSLEPLTKKNLKKLTSNDIHIFNTFTKPLYITHATQKLARKLGFKFSTKVLSTETLKTCYNLQKDLNENKINLLRPILPKNYYKTPDTAIKYITPPQDTTIMYFFEFPQHSDLHYIFDPYDSNSKLPYDLNYSTVTNNEIEIIESIRNIYNEPLEYFYLELTYPYASDTSSTSLSLYNQRVFKPLTISDELTFKHINNITRKNIRYIFKPKNSTTIECTKLMINQVYKTVHPFKPTTQATHKKFIDNILNEYFIYFSPDIFKRYEALLKEYLDNKTIGLLKHYSNIYDILCSNNRGYLTQKTSPIGYDIYSYLIKLNDLKPPFTLDYICTILNLLIQQQIISPTLFDVYVSVIIFIIEHNFIITIENTKELKNCLSNHLESSTDIKTTELKDLITIELY